MICKTVIYRGYSWLNSSKTKQDQDSINLCPHYVHFYEIKNKL